MKSTRIRFRARKIFAAGVVLVFLLPFAFALVLRVPAVQDGLVRIVNRRLESASPYAVHLEGLRGNPPWLIRLDRITVSDAEGPWFEAKDLRIRVDGRAGLAGRLRIREAVIAETLWHRLPAPPVQAASARDTPDGFEPFIQGYYSLDILTVSRFRLEPGILYLAGDDPIEFQLNATANASPVEGLAAGFRLNIDGPLPTRLGVRVQSTGGGAPIRLWADLHEPAGGRLDAALPWPVEGGISIEAEASLRTGFAHGDVVFRSGGLGRGRLSWRAERTETWEAEAEFQTRGFTRENIRIDIPRSTFRAWLIPGAERVSFEGAVRDRRAYASVRAEAYRDSDRIGLRDVLVETGPASLRGHLSRRTSDGLLEGQARLEGLDPATLPFLSTFFPDGIPAPWALTGLAEAALEASEQDGRQRLQAELSLEEPASAWVRAQRATLTIEALGPWGRPDEGRGTLAAEAVQSDTIEPLWPNGLDHVRAEAVWMDQTLAIDASAAAPGFSAEVRLATNAEFAWLEAGLPGLTTHPMRGDLELRLDADRLPGHGIPGIENLHGLIQLRLEGRGSVEKPILEGRASWADGRFSIPRLGARLEGIRLVLVGSNNTLRIEEAYAEDGSRGRVEARGQVAISSLQEPPRMDLELETQAFRVIDLPMISARVSGALALAPHPETATGHRVTGTLSARNAEFRIPARLPPHLPQLHIVERDAMPEPGSERDHESRRPAALRIQAPELDISARVSRFRATGRGLDSEWEGTLRLYGSAETPQVIGTLHAVRGRILFLGKRFQLEEARLNWSGPVDRPPSFYSRATTRTGGIRAWVEAHGAIDAPSITLLSDPPGPEDEVLSRVLFGRGLDRLSPFQAMRLAHGLRILQGEGDTWDLLERGQDILQVDQIDFVHDEDMEGIGTVSVGKYISDVLYVEGAKGLGGARDRFSAELELTNSLTLETEASPGLREGIRLRWSRDY